MILGSTFGTLFRVSTFGESHGKALGVIIDGCPAGVELDIDAIRVDMARRAPGQSTLVTPRKEKDLFEIYSGVFEGKTTGTPLMAVVYNSDVRSKDYSEIKDLFRPGHADFSYFAKYRHRDYRGGGRSSARETVARVIAGAIAKQILAKDGVSFKGGVVQVGSVRAENYKWETAEDNDVRCVDPDKVEAMRDVISAARKDRDSVGATVEVWAEGVRPGLGEPVFGKLDAAVCAAMMSLPAAKGVEIGSGFAAVEKLGSENNDEMSKEGFLSNNHGGILGGVSTGAPIVVRTAFKPTSSIPKEKQTITTSFEETSVVTKGRHDPCVALRAVPIAEAMLAMVLLDFWLQDAARRAASEPFLSIDRINYGLKNKA